MKEWIARVVLGFLWDKLRELWNEFMEARASAELKKRADEQIIREHTPLGDDDLDKRLRDGSA
jgi:hypothetical protein